MNLREDALMLQQISKYRSPIMGGCILCVLLYHTGVTFGVGPIDYFIATIYGCIDIFLFLSGFGIYQSLSRNPDSLSFYRRRASKIYPAYIPMLLVWLAANFRSVGLSELPGLVFGNLTGLSFWLQKNPYFNWYILSLPAFYLASPLLVRIIQREKKHEIALLLLFPFLACTCCFGIARLLLFFSRIPCFVLGMLFGKAYLENREPCKQTKLLMLLTGIVFYVIQYLLVHVLSEDTMWHYGLWFYWHVFMLPALLLLYCTMIRIAEKLPVAGQIVKLLSLIGTSTLEIYVIHIVLFDFVPEGTRRLLWLLIAAGMVALGILYHKLLALIQRKLRRQNEPS